MVALTVGSLFSGIGGLDLGLERAGMRVIWQSEIEPFCCKVLAKHWPDVPNHGDITAIDWQAVERPDVLCGGFPCQDVSIAKMGALGVKDGERSGLWRHYADAIRVLRPDYVIIENVAALLRRGLGVVLSDLAGCGYDAEWQMLSAAQFGAPHWRHRVFIVAYPYEVGRLEVAIFKGKHSRQYRPWTLFADCGLASLGGRSFIGLPEDLRRDDGIPCELDSIAAYGNAVVPQVAEYVGRCIVAHANDTDNAVSLAIPADASATDDGHGSP